jgi:hypothetical protein
MIAFAIECGSKRVENLDASGFYVAMTTAFYFVDTALTQIRVLKAVKGSFSLCLLQTDSTSTRLSATRSLFLTHLHNITYTFAFDVLSPVCLGAGGSSACSSPESFKLGEAE